MNECPLVNKAMCLILGKCEGANTEYICPISSFKGCEEL